MSREDIIKQVLAKIDEVGTLSQQDDFSPAGLIDSLMNESVLNMLRNAPLHMLTPVKVNPSSESFIHQANSDGTGYIVVPANFARLYSFKMAAWTRPAESAISVANPKYKQQHNTITRGKPNKPVVALNYFNDGAGLENPDLPIDPTPIEGWSALPPLYIEEQTIYHGAEPGQRHIPSGGELNHILAYAGGSGVAAWTAMTDAIHGQRSGGLLHETATESEHGFMSSYDKVKLNTIQEGANYYIHPDGSGYNHIPTGGQQGDIMIWASNGDARWVDPYTVFQFGEVIEEGGENEFYSWDKTWRQISYDMIAGQVPVNLSNYVTLDGTQTITGAKYFNQNTRFAGVRIGAGTYQSYILAGTLTANTTFTLPANNPSPGNVLTVNISGVPQWANLSQLEKATHADIITGTDDEKYVTSLSIRNSNIFSAEKTGQIAALPEYSNIAPYDTLLIIEQISTGGDKRKVPWVVITDFITQLMPDVPSKATTVEINAGSTGAKYVAPSELKASEYFRLQKETINNVTEKGFLSANDVFLIDDSASTPAPYVKKKVKWSTILTAVGGGGGATTLGALTDVTITTPATGNVLQYNGSAWVNATVSGTAHDRLHSMTQALDHTMSTGKMIGRTSSGSGAPEEMSSSDVLSFLSITEADWKNENITKAQIEAVLTDQINSHSHDYDKYTSWNIAASGTTGSSAITSATTVTFTGAGGTTVTRSGNNIIISSSGGSVAEADPYFTAWLNTNPLAGFLTSESDPYGVDSISVSGTTTKTITITLRNSNTVSTTFEDLQGGGTSYSFMNSITESGGNVSLVNDSASPGASKYYGTNASGAKGYYDLPEGGVSNYSWYVDVDGGDAKEIVSGEYVKFNAGTGLGVSFSITGGGAIYNVQYSLNAGIGELNDVNESNPVENQVLRYNGSAWVNSDDTAYSWGNHASIGYLTSLTVDGGITLQGTVTAPIIKIVSIDAENTGAIVVSGGAIGVALGTTNKTAAAGNHTHSDLHTRSHAITSTDDHSATAHRIFYSNATGNITELAFGTNKQLLISKGVDQTPEFVSLSSLDSFGVNTKGLVPGAPSIGKASELFLSAAGTWLTPAGTGTGFANPMTSVGDMIVGSTDGSAVKLGIGTVNQVLMSNGTTPYWATMSGSYTHPNHTGDVTSSGDGATTLQPQAISNKTAATTPNADAKFLFEYNDVLGYITASNIKKYVVPFNAPGQLLYAGSGGAISVLPANTTATRTVLSQVSSATTWLAFTLANLIDTPSSYNAGKFLRSTSSGYEHIGIDTTNNGSVSSALAWNGTNLFARLQNETNPVLGANLNANNKNITGITQLEASALRINGASSEIGTSAAPWQNAYLTNIYSGTVYFGAGTTYYLSASGDVNLRDALVRNISVTNDIKLGGNNKFKIRYNNDTIEFRYGTGDGAVIAKMQSDGNMIFLVP